MVNTNIYLDNIFGSLADATRRDILRRLMQENLSVGEIAAPYSISLPAISRHLRVLEEAKLIIKQRRGKGQVVQLSPKAINDVAEYFEWYKKHSENRFDNLDAYLSNHK